MEEHITDTHKRRRIEEQQQNYAVRELIRNTQAEGAGDVKDLMKNVKALQKWEIDPRHRDLVKTVSRVVQSMEVKALDAVESMLGNGTVEGVVALQHLRRLSGHEGDMAVAAHTLRRTPRTRNALVGLVGTEMLVAGGSTFERTGTQIHASKTLQADLLWAQTRFVEVLNACYEVRSPLYYLLVSAQKYGMRGPITLAHTHRSTCPSIRWAYRSCASTATSASSRGS